MAGDQTTEEETSRRPKDSKLKQQKLPAWQPILTAETVLIVFIAIGLAFIPIGVGLFLVQNNVKEYSVDYTECMYNSSHKCSDIVQQVNNTGCSCTVDIEVEEDMKAEVYMYYGLTSFYQNHRRYVKSRDDNQLRGKDVDLTDDCSPYKTDGGQNIAPCGAIANSLFNDSFTLSLNYTNGTLEAVPLLRTGIAWSTDRNAKFSNPAHDAGTNLSTAFTDTVKPPNWAAPVYELDTGDDSNNGYNNEDLIVWMRTSALPNFRKLYRRIKQEGTFKTVLPAGTYSVTINYNFPVTTFGGTKSVILSTTSIFGGKNLFLGIAYMVVGSLCIVLGIVFLIIHCKFGKRPEAMTNIDRETPY